MQPAWAQREQPYSLSTIQQQPAWVQLMYAPKPDIPQVRAAYEAYYRTHKFVKNRHTQYYKRLLHDLTRDQDGTRFNTPKAEMLLNQKQYLAKTQKQAQTRSANWQCIGPIDFDREAVNRSYAPGAAHVYITKQSPSNDSVLYAGSAEAGVWKSTDKGLHWLNVTAHMMISSVAALEIDSHNPNIVWFGGAGKLHKTTDGGISWLVAGDPSFNAQSHDIREIRQHGAQLFVSSDKGLYRSADGGASFTLVVAGDFQEIEIHPTDTLTLYSIQQINNGTAFWKSTDGGVSFNQTGNGYPVPASGEEQKRTEIAVTPAAPNRIVAYATGEANGGTGLYGIYISSDAGQNWSFACCGTGPGGVPDSTNLNLCGWDAKGLDDGGQYYYDLALEISPTDSLLVHAGAVNHWLSTDGGSTWTCPSAWSDGGSSKYVHADIHDIRYVGSDLWIACDGGIFYSNDAANTVNRRMYGIAGTDFWGFGMGHAAGRNVMLGGTYHNGTLLKDNQVYTHGWISTDGGDGTRGGVNPGNSRVVYSDYGKKVLSGDRTIKNKEGSMAMQPNASYVIGESSRYYFHPHLHNTLIIGKDAGIYRSDDNGGSFNLLHDFGQGKITSIEIYPKNADIMYAVQYTGFWDDKKLWKTTDGGISWSEITPANSLFNNNELWVAWDIALSDSNPNELWLARTPQYDWTTVDGYKIFHSTDGGASWQNITTAALNGEYLTNIEYQRGTNGGIYLGTRRSVYYRNNTMPDWDLYGAGLPVQTGSTLLMIDYAGKKIRNATNRSVWEADLYESSTVQAQLSADRKYVVCTSGNTVSFSDRSVVDSASASWLWSFPGGNPSSSTAQKPVVQYSTQGTFPVYLTVTDQTGTDSDTALMLIEVGDNIGQLPLQEGFENGNFPPQKWFNQDQQGTWEYSQRTGGYGQSGSCVLFDNYNHFPDGALPTLWTSAYDLSTLSDAKLLFDVAYAEYGGQYTDSLSVVISMDCGATYTEIYRKGGGSLATSPNVTDSLWLPTPLQWRTDTVSVQAFAGKKDVMIGFQNRGHYGQAIYLDNILLNTITASVAVPAPVESLLAYPNPTQHSLHIVFQAEAKPYTLALSNALGQTVLTETIAGSSDIFTKTLDLTGLSAGVYFLSLSDGTQQAQRKIVLY